MRELIVSKGMRVRLSVTRDGDHLVCEREVTGTIVSVLQFCERFDIAADMDDGSRIMLSIKDNPL